MSRRGSASRNISDASNNSQVLYKARGAAVKRVTGKLLAKPEALGDRGKQPMASLPAVRIQQDWFPFQPAGLKYFGLLLVKNGRKAKQGYGCPLACLQMRTLHLDFPYSTLEVILLLRHY